MRGRMRKLVCFIVLQAFFLNIVSAACPSPLDPLPQLPLPFVNPPAASSCPTTPAVTQLDGYLPITFYNNSLLSADDIYICVLVNSSTQYLSFSGSPEVLGTITNLTPITYINNTTYDGGSVTKYSYKLSEFQNIDTDKYTFYIPNDGNTGVAGSNVMKSSRILISLYEPLTYFINNAGLIGFPPEFDQTQDVYYILNDKIEFDLGSNALNRLNLNLTGVDFFGLPLNVNANYLYFFGSSFSPNYCAVTGMPTSVTLKNVFDQYRAAKNKLQSPFDTYWAGLIATYTNPDGSGDSDLRIYAPATAMASTQTQTNPTPVTFPTDYFLRSAYSPDECTWFNAVWSGISKSGAEAFYQNKKTKPYIVVDATTTKGAATAIGKETDDNSFRFVIKGGPDDTLKVIFPEPSSSKAFFTGAIEDYQPAISSNASSDTQKQVLKVFATSIIGGFFPLNCQYPTKIVIDNTYVQNHSSEYYQNNAILTKALGGCDCVANVPWWDFYSRTLLTIGTPNLFYTSAYSDFLGTDGTIVIVNPNTDNKDATFSINIADCSTGITRPNPYSDATSYTVTFGLPSPSDVTVEFSTDGTSWTGTLPSTAAGNAFFLKVTYHSGIYSGKAFITQIAPAQEIFHPVLPGQGTITTTGTSTTVSLGISPTS